MNNSKSYIDYFYHLDITDASVSPSAIIADRMLNDVGIDVSKCPIYFFKKNENAFLECYMETTLKVPPVADCCDYRFSISAIFCEALAKKFPEIKVKFSKGYDLILTLNGVEYKISVKIAKDPFERKNYNKKNKTTTPKPIILKNALGKDVSIEDFLDFDYTIVIGRGNFRHKYTNIAFGIFDKNVYLDRKDQLITKGDQLKLFLKNDQYNFISKMVEILSPPKSYWNECDTRFLNANSKFINEIIESSDQTTQEYCEKLKKNIY
jgi:hypothetical protein